MSKEYHYDLVIVGAGPAGSSAAYAAARNGIKVALLEREDSVAQTVRTSGVTWIQSIKEFGIPDDCYNPIKNFSFCSPNNQVTISDTVARAAVLDVRKTYRWLANQAKEFWCRYFSKNGHQRCTQKYQRRHCWSKWGGIKWRKDCISLQSCN